MVGQEVVVADGEILAEEVLKIELLGDTDFSTADPLAILDVSVAIDDRSGPRVIAGIVIQKIGYREDTLPFQVVDVQIHAGADADVQNVVRVRACLVLEIGVLEVE
jgi:hypothetical protein